jgi:hypothetical protein
VDSLKVTLRLQHGDDFHLDSLDLAQDGHRRRFIERAAQETGLEPPLVKRDLGQLLLAVEEHQHRRLTEALPPVVGDKTAADEMTDEERAEALAFLKSPDLIARIDAAFDACGLVGESTNRLAAYLACTSRKLDRPLAVIIQSSSSAGKSTLMEAVLATFPPEDQIKYSAMTGQSLYYLGETNLQHKILAIVEEEGAERASYALKLLQSEGELTIASTGKDAKSGRMETVTYRVQGPVMLFLTTTAVDIDEELQNRCLVLAVDESPDQTRRIHERQRHARTLDGLRLKKEKAATLRVLRNAQRLLEPLDIVNPHARALTFTAGRTRTRRDHEKYLTLIDTITLLHQHQRHRSRWTHIAAASESEAAEGKKGDQATAANDHAHQARQEKAPLRDPFLFSCQSSAAPALPSSGSAGLATGVEAAYSADSTPSSLPPSQAQNGVQGKPSPAGGLGAAPPSSLGGTYLEVTLADIALANRLAPVLLGRCLDDLPPQTRRLLDAIHDLVRRRAAEEAIPWSEVLFSRREIRLSLGWSVTQTRIHLDRLQEHDCITPARGRFGQTFLYALLLDPDHLDGIPILLADTANLPLPQQPDGT